MAEAESQRGLLDQQRLDDDRPDDDCQLPAVRVIRAGRVRCLPRAQQKCIGLTLALMALVVILPAARRGPQVAGWKALKQPFRKYDSSARGGLSMPASPTQYDGIEDRREVTIRDHDDDGVVHVFAIGDWGAPIADHLTAFHTGGGDERSQFGVAGAMKGRAKYVDPQYVLNVGDNFYMSGIPVDCNGPPGDAAHGQTFEHFSSSWQAIYGDLAKKPWLSTLGNHDYGGQLFNQGWPQQIGYSFVNHNWVMPGRYFSRRMEHPDVVVDYFMIDSNAFDAMKPGEDPNHNICSTAHNPAGAQCSGGLTSENCVSWFWDSYAKQKTWLEAKIKASTADWKIVVTHFPCGYDGAFYQMLHDKYGLDLLVTGHRHHQELWWNGTKSKYVRDFMQKNDLGDLTCLVSGGGGGITHEWFANADYGTDLQWYGFFDLSISKAQMKIELVNIDGETTGNVTLYPQRKAAAPEKAHAVAAEDAAEAAPARTSTTTLTVTTTVTLTTTVTTTATATTTTTAAMASSAPVQEFYTYRAVPENAYEKYPFGNTNTGNPEGVMWYLTNEVVTMYTQGPRCPRKFNISKIMRLKVKSKATPEVFKQGMNFGARFAYDFGNCSGRCFTHNLCTGHKDCDVHYAKYGYVVGCNNFWDMSVFPDFATAIQNGIWYTFPLEGRCSHPTGDHNCTWSVEHAGEVTLEELEKLAPAPNNYTGNCCGGRCSMFWENVQDEWQNSQRVQVLKDMFAKKYPAGSQLEEPFCDFNQGKWYNPDSWPRRDPWAKHSDPGHGNHSEWPGQEQK